MGNTNAVGQMQGYLLQVRHMLYNLISLEDIVVSIEKIDDVSVETLDGIVIAEQLKSVTSDGNPITERSIVFWKTLYNWFNYVKSNKIVLDKTVFRMVVVSNHSLIIGGIVEQFHKSKNKQEAQKSLEKAKQKIWGKDDSLKSKVPSTYEPYLEILFSAKNIDLVAEIISRFEIEVHDANYDENLLKRFMGQTIPSEFADNLFIFMLGWVTEEVNKYMKIGLPAIVESSKYRNILVAQCRMYNQQKIIPQLSSLITKEDAETEVESQDIYIRQLDLIQMSFDEKLDAASDYLQTKAEKTIRAEKGLFMPQFSNNYHDTVFRLWKSKRKQILFSRTNNDEEIGQLLYAEMEGDVTLIDSSLPSFFGSGTLQSMANKPSGEPEIGWHPNYKKLLKEKSDE